MLPPSNPQPGVTVASSVLILAWRWSRWGKWSSSPWACTYASASADMRSGRKAWWDRAKSRLGLPTLTAEHTFVSIKQLWILRLYPNRSYSFDGEKAYILFMSRIKVLTFQIMRVLIDEKHNFTANSLKVGRKSEQYSFRKLEVN